MPKKLRVRLMVITLGHHQLVENVQRKIVEAQVHLNVFLYTRKVRTTDLEALSAEQCFDRIVIMKNFDEAITLYFRIILRDT